MRVLVVLCLIGAACAQYNYNPGASGGSYDGAASNVAPSLDGGFDGGHDGAASYSSPSYSAPAELEKEFYTFSADENDFNDPAASEQVNNSVKKGLRVVFIKGPENHGLENAALALAKQAAQQQTAIYVLNKQHDINDLAQKFNAARSDQNNRPEVHFVKYRTPEDAANAQRAIQGQYDSLGGSTKNLDGGVANAINFASQSPAAHQHSQHQSAPSAPGASYLPANILRRLRLRI